MVCYEDLRNKAGWAPLYPQVLFYSRPSCLWQGALLFYNIKIALSVFVNETHFTEQRPILQLYSKNSIFKNH